MGSFWWSVMYPGAPNAFQDYEIRAPAQGSLSRLLIVGGGGEAFISSICTTSP